MRWMTLAHTVLLGEIRLALSYPIGAIDSAIEGRGTARNNPAGQAVPAAHVALFSDVSALAVSAEAATYRIGSTDPDSGNYLSGMDFYNVVRDPGEKCGQRYRRAFRARV